MQEEEECKRHSSTGGDSQPDLSSPPLESCDVSMAKEGPQQRVSDVIVEEEREESMETDAPLDLAAPTLLKEKDLEAKVKEDCHSQTSEGSTDQNLPHNSDPDEDELLGPPADISVPGDTPMILSPSSFPREMMTCECAIYASKSTTTTRTHGLKPMASGSFEPASPASRNRSNFDFVRFICINHVLF